MATDDAFAEALRSAFAKLAPAPGERFPVVSNREPESPTLGTDFRASDQSVSGQVPRVPTVPSENEDRSQRTPAPDLAEAWAAWQARAAIREYDGGMTRQVAELLTAMELGPCPAAPDEFRLS